uniref:Caspase family p20 domain-containing protein n=1 Tax=Ditylenchus dipsaci TaxID=166011 RepID=A0A915E837_9BILA
MRFNQVISNTNNNIYTRKLNSRLPFSSVGEIFGCRQSYNLSHDEAERYRQSGNLVSTSSADLATEAKQLGIYSQNSMDYRRSMDQLWIDLSFSCIENSVLSFGQDRNRFQFPTPQYEWFEEDRPMDVQTKWLVILRCLCSARSVFKCRVWNFVEEDEECKKKLNNICRLVGTISEDAHPRQVDPQLDTLATEDIVASDKVALIISNRTYAPLMANLITPHCDAESLADALQQLKFKTVTLGDLRLDEMKFIIQEYRKLFGEGVYAVFYFVGHGFEANGQCYLLPIGAPAENYGPEDSLNLILLDICRKFLPSNLEAFNTYAEKFRREVKVNRNTVYGYATSGGVGAYEVKGEVNGVFMKYLKNRINHHIPVLDMLNKVFRDIEKDKKVRDVQIPEMRSNITKPRSLMDPLIFSGHTTSFDHHTLHWRLMHELPNPVNTEFDEQELVVTIWFDFCGHFTNKVYVFSSVGDTRSSEGQYDNETKAPSDKALSHLAYLKFSRDSGFEASGPKICTDDAEGVSICVMLSNLQRSKAELSV